MLLTRQGFTDASFYADQRVVVLGQPQLALNLWETSNCFQSKFSFLKSIYRQEKHSLPDVPNRILGQLQQWFKKVVDEKFSTKQFEGYQRDVDVEHATVRTDMLANF